MNDTKRIEDIVNGYATKLGFRTQKDLDKATQAIHALIHKARIDELQKLYAWVKDYNDNVAYNIELRIKELENDK